LDSKLIKKVCRLKTHGYKQDQPNIVDWIASKKVGPEAEAALLRKWMAVKEDKPNSCYHFDVLLKDLKTMSAQDFLVAIRSGRGENMPGTAYELLWEHENRFKSVMSFRNITNDLPN